MERLETLQWLLIGIVACAVVGTLTQYAMMHRLVKTGRYTWDELLALGRNTLGVVLGTYRSLYPKDRLLTVMFVSWRDSSFSSC